MIAGDKVIIIDHPNFTDYVRMAFPISWEYMSTYLIGKKGIVVTTSQKFVGDKKIDTVIIQMDERSPSGYVSTYWFPREIVQKISLDPFVGEMNFEI